MANITIPDNDLEYLNAPAKSELKKALLKNCSEIVKEAGRLESVGHTTNNNPEITSSHIKDAVVYLSRGYVKHKKTFWDKIVIIITAISGLISGSLFNMEKLQKDQNSLYLFIIFFVIFAFSIMYNTLKD